MAASCSLHKGCYISLLCLLVFFLAVSGRTAHAQSTSISGQIIDSTGAVIQHAQVTLTNERTHAVLKITSDANGLYSLSHVPSGSYTMDVEAPGFKHYEQTGIAVASAHAVTLDARLQVGSASQTVTVNGSKELAGGQIATEGHVGILGDMAAQDTPFSVVSYTNTYLQNIQATTLTDALAANASVVSSQPTSRASAWIDGFFIRGFPLDPILGLSMNGLYGLAASLPNMDTVERIDLFLGPSAFLNGAPAAVGGTINLVTKRAGDKPFLRLTPDYLGNNIFGGHVDASERFGPNGAFGVRVNGNYRKGNGVIQNNRLFSELGSLGADYRSKRVLLSFDAIYEHQGNRGFTRGITLASTLTHIPSAMPGHFSTQPSWVEYNNTPTRYLGRADVAISSNWTVTGGYGTSGVNYGWDGYCFPTLQNYDGDVTCSAYGYLYHVRTLSGDIGIRGKVKTGPITHTILVGGNGVGETYDDRYTPAAIDNSTYNLYRSYRPATPATAPVYIPLYKFLYSGISGFYLGDMIGAFHGRLMLTGGVRRSRVESDSYSTTGATTSSSGKAAFTPAVAALYKVSPRVSVYGNWIQALEVGGVAPSTATNANQVFPPLVDNQVEGGAKVNWGRWEGTVALYQIHKANQYLDTTTNTYTQSGLQQNRGIELNFNGDIVPGLHAIISTSFIDPKQIKTSGGIYNGKDANGVPGAVERLNLDWDVPWIKGLGMNGTLLETGSAEFDSKNTFRVPSWTQLDLGARYRFGTEKPTTFRVFVANVAAANYWTTFSNYSGYLNPSGPRVVQAFISKEF